MTAGRDRLAASELRHLIEPHIANGRNVSIGINIRQQRKAAINAARNVLHVLKTDLLNLRNGRDQGLISPGLIAP